METPRPSLEELIRELDPESPEFASVSQEVARKTAAYRRDFGIVPYDVYIAVVEMASIQPAIEVLIFDNEGNMYLKRRSSAENVSQAEKDSWEGKLHIPGKSVASARYLELNFYQLLKNEIIDVEDEYVKRRTVAELYKKSEFIGIQMSEIPERKTNGLTTLVRITLDDLSYLKKGFEKVTEDNFSEVIDQHIPIIKEFMTKGKLPIFLDTRKGSKPK